jgi:hypothetical protein
VVVGEQELLEEMHQAGLLALVALVFLALLLALLLCTLVAVVAAVVLMQQHGVLVPVVLVAAVQAQLQLEVVVYLVE